MAESCFILIFCVPKVCVHRSFQCWLSSLKGSKELHLVFEDQLMEEIHWARLSSFGSLKLNWLYSKMRSYLFWWLREDSLLLPGSFWRSLRLKSAQIWFLGIKRLQNMIFNTIFWYMSDGKNDVLVGKKNMLVGRNDCWLKEIIFWLLKMICWLGRMIIDWRKWFVNWGKWLFPSDLPQIHRSFIASILWLT